jgi:hypothetical protein
MTIRYVITFEFDLRPPVTHRGTVAASKVHTCVRLATQQAAKALRPQGWSSMVVCLLERVPAALKTAEVETAEVETAEVADPVA